VDWTFIPLNEKLPEHSSRGPFAKDTWYLGNNGGALALYGITTGWGSISFYSPAYVLTDQILANNGTFASTVAGLCLGSVFDVTVQTTVSSISGTITVPAGTFSNCKLVLISETATLYGVSFQNFDSAAWVLAPGVGIIRDGVQFLNTPTGPWLPDNGYLELISGTYTSWRGALQVTINPSGAVSAGAQWRVDGGAWQNNGATVSALSVGSHTVGFKTVAGWNTPDSQSVTIDNNSTAATSGAYTKTPPTLISPLGSVAASSTQRYTWKADPAAAWYELYVARNGSAFCDTWFASGNSVVDSATGNFAVDVSGHTAGNYQWLVRGYGSDGLGPWSSLGSFAMAPPPPPGPVSLLVPVNNANLQARRPQFTWMQSSPMADWYCLSLTRNGIKYLDQWTQGTASWIPATDLPAGAYSWSVLPWSAAGYGPLSTSFAFTIPAAVPGAITLVSPTGSVAAGSTQRYTWKAEAAASWYELYVTRNGSGFCDKWIASGDSVVAGATGNFAVDVSGHTGGAYQWWVRGWGADGLGPWSSTGSFTMTTPPPPGIVTLLAPVNNANFQARRPQFTWTRSNPAADWYYLYLTRNGSKYLDQWMQGATNWTSTADLPAGSYSWWVLPWSEVGYGSVSTSFTFTIPVAVPGSITQVAPAGSVAASSIQRYTWKADSAAAWYELFVARNGGVFCDKWFTSGDSVVVSATGNFAVDVSAHTSGSYQWWVRGWSPDGLGVWASGMAFQQP
jgi:hypothetical protein